METRNQFSILQDHIPNDILDLSTPHTKPKHQKLDSKNKEIEAHQQQKQQIKKNNQSNQSNQQTNGNAAEGRRMSVAILGDSMIKDTLRHKFMPKQTITYKISVSGAKTYEVLDYAVPLIKRKCKNFIIHCGTNDYTLDPKKLQITS